MRLITIRFNIALVSQDVALFNDTVAANIAYGAKADATEREIIAAAEAANAMGFIRDMPQGLQTVVGENGAFYFRHEPTSKRMIRRYAKDDGQRRIARERLHEVRQAVLAEVPGAAVAADQAYREADLAIDFREDVPPLPRAAVDSIVAIFERFGATAKVSSIHVNGWFGGYDKLSTSQLLFQEAFGRDLEQARPAVVFVGDSPNDAPMFGYFPNAVGVANVREALDAMPEHPRWITEGRSAHGFAEVANALIEAKGRQPRS